MNRVLWLAVLVFASFPSLSQDAAPDWHKLSNAKLLNCATDLMCGADRYELSEEFGKRHAHRFLIQKYDKAGPRRREFIIEALTYRHTPETTVFLRQVAYARPRNAVVDDDVWGPLEYLAEECDSGAMDRLLGKQNYAGSTPVACVKWHLTMRQFGKCRYKPAIPRLIEVSGDNYACLNIPEDALKSLDDFFPHACDGAKSFKAASRCFANNYRDSVSRVPERK